MTAVKDSVREEVITLIRDDYDIDEKKRNEIIRVLNRAPLSDVERIGNAFMRFGARTVMEIVAEKERQQNGDV